MIIPLESFFIIFFHCIRRDTKTKTVRGISATEWRNGTEKKMQHRWIAYCTTVNSTLSACVCCFTRMSYIVLVFSPPAVWREICINLPAVLRSQHGWQRRRMTRTMQMAIREIECGHSMRRSKRPEANWNHKKNIKREKNDSILMRRRKQERERERWN